MKKFCILLSVFFALTIAAQVSKEVRRPAMPVADLIRAVDNLWPGLEVTPDGQLIARAGAKMPTDEELSAALETVRTKDRAASKLVDDLQDAENNWDTLTANQKDAAMRKAVRLAVRLSKRVE